MGKPAQEIEYTDTSRLDKARNLVLALETGDEEDVETLLNEITVIQETRLFQEVGKLTRQLHNAMLGFALDTKIAELTEEIPDTKERLNYVISMTQQAADTTLNAVEELIPLSEQLGSKNKDLSAKWERFLQREMPYAEFKELSQELCGYFSHANTSIETIDTKLKEILMAQGFQDLTGQIIRRVIELVHDMEESLVELIRFSGQQVPIPQSKKENDVDRLEGPVVPGVNSNESVGNQDDVDDLLSSLGF